MRRLVFLAVVPVALALAACGREARVSTAEGVARGSHTRLYIHVDGMVKALGIT